MTPEERRQHLQALRDDLQAEIHNRKEAFEPIKEAYDRAETNLHRLNNQLEQVKVALQWLGPQNDPVADDDKPLPF